MFKYLLKTLGVYPMIFKWLFAPFAKTKPTMSIKIHEMVYLLIARSINSILFLLSLLSVVEMVVYLLMSKSHNGFHIPFLVYSEKGISGFIATFLYLIVLLSCYLVSSVLKLFINSGLAKEFWNPAQTLKVWKISLLFIAPIFLSVIIGQSFAPEEIENW